MSKVKNDESAKSGKSSNNLSKVTKKPKKGTVTDRMVRMIRHSFDNLFDDKGLSLAKIRNFIANNFEVEMTTTYYKTIFKKAIHNEFKNGRIVMTNDTGDKINYSKRFEMVTDADAEEDASDSSDNFNEE